MCRLHQEYRESVHTEEPLYAVHGHRRLNSVEMAAMGNDHDFENTSKIKVLSKSRRSQKLIVLKGEIEPKFRSEIQLKSCYCPRIPTRSPTSSAGILL